MLEKTIIWNIPLRVLVLQHHSSKVRFLGVRSTRDKTHTPHVSSPCLEGQSKSKKAGVIIETVEWVWDSVKMLQQNSNFKAIHMDK